MSDGAFQLRRQIIWLLVAQLVVIAPLLTVLPAWLIGVWAAVAFWYWRIAQSGWSFPPALLKVSLTVGALAAIYLQFRQLLGLEPMLALLVLAVTLKLLELKGRRDHWIILILCYFIVACRFLFDQQITGLLIALLQVWVLLMAQQSLNRQNIVALPMAKTAGVLALQAIPLMVFLFLVFPRIGPLWSMPLPGKDARTGMSDSLEFGDIAQLIQSGERAFRVSFEDGSLPSVQSLYWRGLVLDHFDGRRWKRSDFNPARTAPKVDEGPGTLEYTVTLEPGVHDWLYTLAVASISRDDLRYAGNYQWMPRAPLTGRFQYSVSSDLDASRSETSAYQTFLNTRLLGRFNPRARALGEQWQDQFESGKERVAAALAFFRRSPFVYTLSPPTLGDNNVDEFIFDTRQGFCEHFAGSFVFLMRAAGVPARLVVGYLGGEYNRADRYLLVHQSDAHAWAEVWLEGEGWRRVDPTAVVAPERIERGAEQILRGQEAFLSGSPLSLRHFAWATRMRMYFDNLNYMWARWVLSYDRQSQYQTLLKLLGEVTPQRLLLGLAICGGLPMLLVALSAIRLPPALSRDPATRYYLQCCRAMARRGVSRRPGETPEAYLQRVKTLAPEWAPWMARVTALFSELDYRAVSEERRTVLLRELKSLRRASRQPSSISNGV